MNYTINDLKTHLAKLSIMAGHTTTANDNHTLASLFMEELPKHKTISFDEFKYLTELGVKNELGDFVHLSFSSICKMIKTYKDSEFKKAYNRDKLKPVELPDISQAAKDEMNRKAILAILSDDKCLDASLPICYDYCVNSGIVDKGNGAILFWKDAKKSVEVILERKKLKAATELDVRAVNEIRREIDSVMLGESGSTDIQFTAKVLYMRANKDEIIKKLS